MIEFVGMRLEDAKKKAEEMGLEVLVKENYVHQNFLATPMLFVSNAKLQNGKLLFVVCEFFDGGENA